MKCQLCGREYQIDDYVTANFAVCPCEGAVTVPETLTVQAQTVAEPEAPPMAGLMQQVADANPGMLDSMIDMDQEDFDAQIQMIGQMMGLDPTRDAAAITILVEHENRLAAALPEGKLKQAQQRIADALNRLIARH